MTAARLILTMGMLGAGTAGCHPQPQYQSGAPVRGDVTRNTAAARADTARALKLIEDKKFAEAEPVLRRAIKLWIQPTARHTTATRPGLLPVGKVVRRGVGVSERHQTSSRPAAAAQQSRPRSGIKRCVQRGRAGLHRGRHLAGPAGAPKYAGNLARVRIRLGERDEETRRLLEIVIIADTRPEWVEWARSNLTRLRMPIPEESQPTTHPE